MMMGLPHLPPPPPPAFPPPFPLNKSTENEDCWKRRNLLAFLLPLPSPQSSFSEITAKTTREENGEGEEERGKKFRSRFSTSFRVSEKRGKGGRRKRENGRWKKGENEKNSEAAQEATPSSSLFSVLLGSPRLFFFLSWGLAARGE